MFLEKIRIKYRNGKLRQIRLFKIPIIQYVKDDSGKKYKKITFPLFRKPKKDRMFFYLKVNSNNYGYAVFCISHWLNIVHAYGGDYCILCDNKDIEYFLLKTLEFPDENIKFIKSKRNIFKKIIKNTCTKQWKKPGYAHLSTYYYAKKYKLKEYWNIDADDTILFASDTEVARCLKEIENYAREKNIHAFSLDMHRSAFRGLQWTFGITFTQMNTDIEKALLTYGTNKKWQKEYHNKVLDIPLNTWQSNLDAYYTYLKDKKVLNIGTFNINNLYFIHWGDCIIHFILRSLQIAKDGRLIFPFSSSIDKRRNSIPIYKDVHNFNLNINEMDSYNFVHGLLYSNEKRMLKLRENYDQNIKIDYENSIYKGEK